MTVDEQQEIENLLLKLKSQSSYARITALEKIFQYYPFSSSVTQYLYDLAQNDPDGEVRRFILETFESFEKSKQEEERKENLAKNRKDVVNKKKDFLLTTTPLIDGKHIEKYLGIVSSEIVLGTGVLSELGAGIADVFGARATGFQKKLRDAKDVALKEIVDQSIDLGANAVVGIDIDYMTFANNLFMLSVTGTAVILSDKH